MDEFELIREHFVREDEATDIITGIGDDGAVLRPPAGKDLVTVVDTLVQGVHFPSDDYPRAAESVGHRAVTVNLSDIAAMGAEPRWMTLALTLKNADDSWLRGFATGLHNAAAEHSVHLVGGDTTRGDAIVVTVQVTGYLQPGRAVCRSGARAGDIIYVSGYIGDAAAGLSLITNPPTAFLDEHAYLHNRFRWPTACIELGRALPDIATAAIDVSDGLYADLGKILVASGVGADLDLQNIPLSKPLKSCFEPQQCLRFALSGGDDYELCFTSSQHLPAKIGDIGITAIGTVVEGDEVVCRDQSGIVEFVDSGYLHFR